jgi:hypothetical protein
MNDLDLKRLQIVEAWVESLKGDEREIGEWLIGRIRAVAQENERLRQDLKALGALLGAALATAGIDIEVKS